jgi:aspartyl/asparaginyl-tRNA synthetase
MNKVLGPETEKILARLESDAAARGFYTLDDLIARLLTMREAHGGRARARGLVIVYEYPASPKPFYTYEWPYKANRKRKKYGPHKPRRR